MDIPAGKKAYFLSDFHLGAPDHASSLDREKRIVRFLDTAWSDAAILFIVGDLFDFWFEYRKVVPKGFVRMEDVRYEDFIKNRFGREYAVGS